MSDEVDLRHEDEHGQENEAVQAVVDRVLSYHGGAAVDTVRAELAEGLSKIGESRPDAWLQDHAERISKADPAQS